MIPVDPTAFWPLIVAFAGLIVGAVVWKLLSL
jgi:hypothetical protein